MPEIPSNTVGHSEDRESEQVADEDLVVSGVSTVVKQIKKHGAMATIIFGLLTAIGTGIWQGTASVFSFVSDKCVAPIVDQQIGYLKEQRDALQSFKKAVDMQSALLGSLDKNIEKMNSLVSETHRELEQNGAKLDTLVDRKDHSGTVAK